MLSTITGIELKRIKQKADLTYDDLTKLTKGASEILKLEIDVNSQSNVSTQDEKIITTKMKKMNSVSRLLNVISQRIKTVKQVSSNLNTTNVHKGL